MNKDPNNTEKKESRKLPGFYIALCCCVLAIGIVGYIAERRSDNVVTTTANQENEEYEATPLPTLTATIPPSEYGTGETYTASSGSYTDYTDYSDYSDYTYEEEAAYAVDNPDVTGEAITVSSEIPAFILPVSGNILGYYSDKPAYNTAMADWRTHDGVDIAAEVGCSVQAAASGVVDKISSDASGAYVEISHSGGITTRYMGLDGTESLAEGSEVQSGEVIGTVGAPKGESVTDPHLHFEIIRNGTPVDPLEYLPL